MIMVALGSSLLGAVLGTRFRVQVLFPALLFCLLVLATVTVVKGLSLSTAIAAAAICIVSLQMGYLGGLFTRYCMVAAKVVIRPSPLSTTSRS